MFERDVAALTRYAYERRYLEAEAALPVAQEAALLAWEQDADSALCQALVVQATCLLTLDHAYERAQQALEQARPIAEALNDDVLWAELLMELGYCYVCRDQHEQAVEVLEAALAHQAWAELAAQEPLTLRRLGQSYASVGRYSEALETLHRALALMDQPTLAALAAPFFLNLPYERAAIFRQIAVTYSCIGEFSRAIDYYEVALPTFEALRPVMAARTHYNIGIAYQEQQRLDEALAAYQRAMQGYQQLEHSSGEGISRMGVGRIYQMQGQPAEARVQLEQAITRLRDLPDQRNFYADALWLLAELKLEEAQYEQAIAPLVQALQIEQETQRPPLHRAAIHRLLAQALRALGRFEEALNHAEAGAALTEQALTEAAQAEMRRLMVEFDTERAMKDRELSRLRTVELEREIAERREAEASLAQARAELEAKNAELQRIAVRDGLTGLYNRRFLDEQLLRAWKHAERHGEALCVLLADADHFKGINDRFGHATGDAVLRRLAALMAEQLRADDVLARYGGEEFAVLFPNTSLAQAHAAAERIRRAIADFPWDELAPGLAVTLSGGVAARDGQANHERLLSEADALLYQAKASGRNRILRPPP